MAECTSTVSAPINPSEKTLYSYILWEKEVKSVCYKKKYGGNCDLCHVLVTRDKKEVKLVYSYSLFCGSYNIAARKSLII